VLRMKRLISLGTCLLLLAACSSKDPKSPRFAVATFDGGKITRADLNTASSKAAVRFGGKIEDLQDVQRQMLDWQVLNEMVNEKIILRKIGSSADGQIKSKIDDQLAVIKKRFPNDAAYKASLTQASLTEDDLRGEISRQITLELLMQQEKAIPAPATEQEAQDFYKKNAQMWNLDTRLNLRHIYLALPATATAADKQAKAAAAEAIHKRLAAGEDFAKVASETSEDTASRNRGGELPPLSPNQLTPEFQKALQGLKPGGITPAFQSSSGFHIIQLVNRSEPRTVSYEEVRDRILNSLQVERRVDAARKVIEQLRKEAKVEIHITNPAEQMIKQQLTSPAAQGS